MKEAIHSIVCLTCESSASIAKDATAPLACPASLHFPQICRSTSSVVWFSDLPAFTCNVRIRQDMGTYEQGKITWSSPWECRTLACAGVCQQLLWYAYADNCCTSHCS